MRAKRITFIFCPRHPRAAPPGHPLAGHVKADDHGECPDHGNVSRPRYGTPAYRDARGIWMPGGAPPEKRRNLQVEHVTGQLDAKVRPLPGKFTLSRKELGI